jgi:predicted RNA-binding Zn ribbon-like protein
MAKEIEAIRSSERKPQDRYDIWRSYDTLTSYADVNSEAKSIKHNQRSVDSIETLGRGISSTIGDTLNQAVEQSRKQVSYTGLIDFSKKVWEWFFAPAQKTDNVGSTGKPAGNGVKPIGAAPALSAPEMVIDREMLEKLIKELKEQSKCVSETLNENDEQIKEDQRKIYQAFLDQMKIREDGIESIRFQLIFDQQKDRKIRKENYTFEIELGKVEENHKFWSKVNTGLTIASGIILITMVAGAIIGTGGSAIPIALKCTVSFFKGGCMLYNAKLDQDLGKLKGKSLNLREIHVHITFKMKQKIDQLSSNLSQDKTKIIENLKDMEKSDHTLKKDILSNK